MPSRQSAGDSSTAWSRPEGTSKGQRSWPSSYWRFRRWRSGPWSAPGAPAWRSSRLRRTSRLATAGCRSPPTSARAWPRWAKSAHLSSRPYDPDERPSGMRADGGFDPGDGRSADSVRLTHYLSPHQELTMAIRARMIRVQSAKEAATEVIRGLIHSGEIGAGERISIEALASTLGVSRTPVREALWQLSVEGLVTIQPRVGVLVREIEDQEVLDIYRIKGVLEPLMAEWAAERGTPGQRQQIYDSVDELDAAAEADDVTRYVALLEERRGRLLAIANSSALQDSLGILEGRVRLLRFRNLSRPGQLDRS